MFFEGKTKRLNCNGLFSISQTNKKHVPLTRTGTDPFEFHWQRLAADYGLSNCIGLSRHSAARDATASQDFTGSEPCIWGAAAACKQVLLRRSIMELQTLGGTIVESILFGSHWLLAVVEGEPGRSRAVSPLKEREEQVCTLYSTLYCGINGTRGTRGQQWQVVARQSE